MPFKRSYVKRSRFRPRTFRKRTYKRRSFGMRRRNPKGIVRQRTQIIANKTLVKLPFMQTYQQITIPVSSATNTAFNANGISPTTLTGTAITAGTDLLSGTLPYSYFYSKYCILGSKLLMTLTSEYQATPVNLSVIWGPWGAAQTSSTSLNALSDAQLKMLPGFRTKMLTGFSGSRSQLKISGYRSTRSMMDVKDPIDNAELCGLIWPGLTSAGGTLNPSANWWWYIRVSNNDPTNTGLVDFDYRLIQYVSLSRRQLMPLSEDA